ncbi:hypothetical protein ACFV10_05585 [Streptomyces cyaneofuscatus]|uniref:hypothetical protein n=1 Tax=Streptomyces cyaneofuscatus TaxID=66883 RepID=UPI0036A945A7
MAVGLAEDVDERAGRAAWAGRLEEDEKWRYVSVSTDHDEAEGDGSRWLADQRS